MLNFHRFFGIVSRIYVIYYKNEICAKFDFKLKFKNETDM